MNGFSQQMKIKSVRSGKVRTITTQFVFHLIECKVCNFAQSNERIENNIESMGAVQSIETIGAHHTNMARQKNSTIDTIRVQNDKIIINENVRSVDALAFTHYNC